MSTKKKTTTGKPGGKRAAVPVFTVDPDPMPKHCVVGDEFVAQTDVGEMRVSLRIRERTIREAEGLDMGQQFDVLLASQAPAWVEQLDELDTTDVTILRTLFFVAFQQYQAARLGEALGSSA